MRDYTNEFVGMKIKEVRPLTRVECVQEGWEYMPHNLISCLVLEDDTMLYPSRDTEGNGGGELFITEPDGGQYGLKFAEVKEVPNDNNG